LATPPLAAIEKIAAVFSKSPDAIAHAQARVERSAIPGEGYTTAKADLTRILPRKGAPPLGRFRVLDLFCGAGGFSFGLEQTGRFAITAGIDLLPDRIETFAKNHPSATGIIADIRSFSVERLANEALQPELVIGGPPCQGFSSIRPFRTLTEGDPRNTLFENFILVVVTIRPRWIVLENVVGLLTHEGGTAFHQLLGGFADAGYQTDWRVLNAANYGLPQNRERLIVVGNTDGVTFEWPEPTHFSDHRSMAGKFGQKVERVSLFHSPLLPAVTVMEAIHDLPEVPAGGSADEYGINVVLTDYERAMRNGSSRLTLHDATAHSDRMLKIIRMAGANRSALPEGMTSSGFSTSYSRLDADKPSVTLTVNFVHPASNKCIHPYQDRALTLREGARLQGFPDKFEFCGKRAHLAKQIGNAVPPMLGAIIGTALADAMAIARRATCTFSHEESRGNGQGQGKPRGAAPTRRH